MLPALGGGLLRQHDLKRNANANTRRRQPSIAPISIVGKNYRTPGI